MSIPATEDSRISGGTLTLGGTAFDKQAFSVELVPSVETEGEAIELLNGNKLGPDEKTTWALNIGAVQDFNDPDGFLEYCRSNAGQDVAFVWEPNEVDAPTFGGTVTIRAGKYGGATRIRLTSDVSFPVVDLDDPVYPA